MRASLQYTELAALSKFSSLKSLICLLTYQSGFYSPHLHSCQWYSGFSCVAPSRSMNVKHLGSMHSTVTRAAWKSTRQIVSKTCLNARSTHCLLLLGCVHLQICCMFSIYLCSDQRIRVQWRVLCRDLWIEPLEAVSPICPYCGFDLWRTCMSHYAFRVCLEKEILTTICLAYLK